MNEPLGLKQTKMLSNKHSVDEWNSIDNNFVANIEKSREVFVASRLLPERRNDVCQPWRIWTSGVNA